MHSHPPEYCAIGHYGGSPIVVECLLQGPPGSLYEGQTYTVEITLLDGYPYTPPLVKFLSNRMIHPNIINRIVGGSHLLHFPAIWQNNWTLIDLLQHCIELLQEPQLSLLPEKYLTLYKDWELHAPRNGIEDSSMVSGKKVEEKDKDQQEEEENDEEEKKQKEAALITIEQVTSLPLLQKLQEKFNRIELMHLQLLFLYLMYPVRYRQLVQQSYQERENPE